MSISNSGSPLISVIVATRDRPQLCLRAVQSVLTQNFANIEVVVVDDSYSEENATQCKVAVTALDTRCKYVRLMKVAPGHGPAFSRNVGVEKSMGEFVAFLDDDDCWTNDDHLTQFQTFHAKHPVFDCFFTQQQALLPDGDQVPTDVWLESLLATLEPPSLIDEGVYALEISPLAKVNRFAHVNCTILARSLFDNVGGFDQSLRYEEDKNFFFRVVDRAQKVAVSTLSVGVHYVPDKVKQGSASSSVSDFDKKLAQVFSDLKLLSSIKNSALLRQRELDLVYNLSALGRMYVERGRLFLGYSLRTYAFFFLAYIKFRRFLRG